MVNYIIPQLADPSNAYNAQHLYVLTSLAEVHSIALITDLDRPEQLILNLLVTSFDIVSGSAKASTGEEVTKVVEGYLTKILVQVIEESSSVSPEVTDVIIAQFIRVDPRTEQTGKKKSGQQDGSQGNLLHKTYPRAYLMAKAICSSIPERMTSHISQYFNNVIMDASDQPANHSKSHARHGSFGEADEEAGDLKELRKAHRLIRELWRACPDVLLHVIPQVEQELSAESAPLRSIATETIGDVAAGIGVVGCPPSFPIDPAAYPPQSLTDPLPSLVQDNLLQIPMSPKPFNHAHNSAYESFLGRKQDKAATVRAVWATAAGHVLLTSAGGIGFAEGEERKLQDGLAQLLADADDKVRLAAIRAVGTFGFGDVMSKIAPHGSISTPGSILGTLSDRVRDRKNPVRKEAMHVLARLWAVAAGEIEEGNDKVVTALGDAPSKLLDAYYVNEPEVQLLVDQVLFEYLLPLAYPPNKTKKGKSDTQSEDFDADMVRVGRILTLLQGLDEKAKRVFFGMQNRQTQLSRVMGQYLKACEEFNGGVVEEEDNEATAKKELNKWVDAIAKTLPEPATVAADLRKFANMHDRRNYQLIRFCMNPESDYRTVVKAIKELSKRLQNRSGTTPSLDTMTPLLYRCSLLVYNRSHVPGIVKISREEGSQAEAAHELLKEMSSRAPEVLKTHIQELCKSLESTAPNVTTTEEASAADMLKACAEFARRFPSDVPRDRKFLTALSDYALFSTSPRAAKHAVSIMMTSDKKELYAKELMAKATKDCTYSSPHFLTRLATISQLNLLEPRTAEEACEATIRISTQEVLLKNRHPVKSTEYKWSATPDQETVIKEWALKCLVNFVRSLSDSDSAAFTETASSVYTLLTRLISQEGELSPKNDTPPEQRSYLRLAASRLLVKLCSKQRACEDLVTPSLFNTVALVAHDRLVEVRTGFTAQLKKYLAQDRLNTRWYTILFLGAFEPDQKVQNDTLAWLRSRSSALARRQQLSTQSGTKSSAQNTMEVMLARLLSLVAHHPDFPELNTATTDEELLDTARYIIFYLQGVATEANLSLIFHVAQRVKQTADGITKSDAADERLYILSDLAQATIRHFADLGFSRGTSSKSSGVNLLQTWPGKMRLPLSLFRAVANHDAAQAIADRNYLPEEVASGLEREVRKKLRPGKDKDKEAKEPRERKRKTEAEDDSDTDVGRKKARKSKKKDSTSLPVRTPRPKKNSLDHEASVSSPALPSRKSARRSGVRPTNYDEGDSDADDAEMEDWERVAKAKAAKAAKGFGRRGKVDEDKEGGKENGDVEMHDVENGEGSAAENGQDGSDQEEDGEEKNAGDPEAEEEAEGEGEDEAEEEASPSPTPARSKSASKAKSKAKGKTNAKSPPTKKTAANSGVARRGTRSRKS